MTLQTITDFLSAIPQHIPFTAATWFVISTLGFFCWLFAKASRDPTAPIRWEHLILDSATNRASPYKVGHLVGIIVSTWIVIKLSDSGTLNLDIFGAYLTFLLGGTGINAFIKTTRSSPTTGSDDNDTK